MSVELAKAFCVRMMSDEDFRNSLLNVTSPDEVRKIVDAEYSFSKEDLGKIIGEIVGHKLEEGELEKLICEFFAEQTDNEEACKSVIAWIASIA